MSMKQNDETEVCDAGFTAADMATAAAQGFRDGQAAELAAMRAGGEPVAEMVPYHTPSGKRVAVISRFQHLPIGTKLYTHPKPAAQDAERIQALELEVRQLTEQIVAMRHAPTPQANSVLEDAARYRWLREGNDAKHGAAWHVAVNLYGCEWDAAIDAARKQGANHD